MFGIESLLKLTRMFPVHFRAIELRWSVTDTYKSIWEDTVSKLPLVNTFCLGVRIWFNTDRVFEKQVWSNQIYMKPKPGDLKIPPPEKEWCSVSGTVRGKRKTHNVK
jgi:hypothetical protein